MRRILTQLATVCLLCTGFASAQAYTEGEEYLRLNAPHAASEGTLVKMWTVGCPFCYQYAKLVDPTLAKGARASGLTFTPLLLEAQGEAGRVASEFLIYCQMLDEQADRTLDSEESLYRKAEFAWFHFIHDLNKRTADLDSFLNLALEATGLTREDFEKARSDDRLQSRTDEARWGFEAVQNYGVPAYIVNGRFLIQANRLKGIDDMEKLVAELAQKD